MALVLYGLLRVPQRRAPLKEILVQPDSWRGQELVFSGVRVESLLPQGFIGEQKDVRAPFLGPTDIHPGDRLQLVASLGPEGTAFRVRSHRKLSPAYGTRWLQFAVSAVVAAAVAWNLWRLFRWSGPTGLGPREP